MRFQSEKLLFVLPRDIHILLMFLSIGSPRESKYENFSNVRFYERVMYYERSTY